MTNNVNQPAHYKSGGIETIDYMRAKLSPDAFLGFCIGNVLKYVSRYEHKNGLEDLKKANVYLGWAIEAYKNKEKDDPRKELRFTKTIGIICPKCDEVNVYNTDKSSLEETDVLWLRCSYCDKNSKIDEWKSKDGA